MKDLRMQAGMPECELWKMGVCSSVMSCRGVYLWGNG